jgi:hypothetical protein
MKTLKRITVLMAIMSFIAFQGFSQNVSTNTQKNSQNTQTAANAVPGKFVDNNKDGVCDNYQTRMKNGRGANYVDKNGDGVCDNFKAGGQGKGKGNPNCCGMGYQHRHGKGNGNCCGSGYGYRQKYGNWGIKMFCPLLP